MRCLIVHSLIPVTSLHSDFVSDFPNAVNRTVLRVFLICRCLVAHTQFSFEYPRLLFTLSSDNPSGRGPISSRNASNDSIHRADTDIPRPPYREKLIWVGSLHLLFILLQMKYIFDWHAPCFVRRSARKHPQDFVCPLLSALAEIDSSVPHSHTQFQN
jgi:hypothetical protein